MAPKRNTLMLVISHSIFLNREERYELADGKQIEVVGISVPVWYQKGNTSEPAVEIFCNYDLLNKDDEMSFVRAKDDGYTVNIPQIPKDYKPPKKLTDKQWREMIASPEDREVYYDELKKSPHSGKSLIDYNEGGGQYLRFHHHNKFKKSGRMIDVSHVIEIHDCVVLDESLSF